MLDVAGPKLYSLLLQEFSSIIEVLHFWDFSHHVPLSFSKENVGVCIYFYELTNGYLTHSRETGTELDTSQYLLLPKSQIPKVPTTPFKTCSTSTGGRWSKKNINGQFCPTQPKRPKTQLPRKPMPNPDQNKSPKPNPALKEKSPTSTKIIKMRTRL